MIYLSVIGLRAAKIRELDKFPYLQSQLHITLDCNLIVHPKRYHQIQELHYQLIDQA